jgi:hypothetical protein
MGEKTFVDQQHPLSKHIMARIALELEPLFFQVDG